MTRLRPARRGRHRRRRSVLARTVLGLVLAALAVVVVMLGVQLLDGVQVHLPADAGDVPAATPEGTGRSTGGSPPAGPKASAATTRPPRASAAPAGVPVTLALPKARVTAPVVPVGTRPDGELRLPRSPRVVGWWVRSAPVGDPRDSSLLAGHVDSAAEGVGALAALRDGDVGDKIILTDVFGGRHTYRVAARRAYPKYALPRDIFAVTGRARLVLVTCGGPFDEQAGRYRDNVVVYALPG